MVALIYDSPALKAHFFRGGMKSRPTQVGTATLTNSHKTLQRIQVVAGLLPSAGFSCQVYDQYVTASSPAIIEVSSNKVTLLNANYTYKNESRTMLFATGQMNVLLDDKTYGLNFSFSDNKLTISTSSNGNYGVRIRVITF